MIEKLVGEKIYLRELTLEDWKDVHSYASMDIVCTYQPWGPNSVDETFEFVKLVLNDHDKKTRTRYVFAVVEKESEQMIGSGEIIIQDMINQEAEIGYIIHPDFWGLGYATETGKLLIKFGFTNLHLHRIFATCDPRNRGSAKVLQTIGRKRGICVKMCC